MKKFTEKTYFYWSAVLFLILCSITFIRYPDLRNEMKYFVVISEMLQNKEYLILTYLGDLYPDKPPVYFWILGLIKIIFNTNIYPIALIITGIIPFYIGSVFLKKIFKTNMVGFLFLTTLFASGSSLVLRMDTLMSMFITISITYFYLAYEEHKENTNFQMKGKYYIGIYISIVLAILIKGGGGIVVPLLTMVGFLYLNNDFKFFKKIKIGKGILLILCILAVWFTGMYFSKNGKEYLALMLGKQTVGRIVNSYTHKRPVFYYLQNIFLTTMPFGIMFLTGIILYLKDFKNKKNWTSLEKLCIAWIVPTFIFFSLVSGKLDIYLLPIYPGIAGLIYCFYQRKEWEKHFEISLYITHILFVLIGVGLLIASFIPKYEISFICEGLIAVLLGVSVWFLYKFKKSEVKKEMLPYIGVLVVMLFAIALYEGNDFNRTSTMKYFRKDITEISQKENKKIILYRFEDGINYLEAIEIPYETIKKNEDLKDILEKEEKIILLTRKKYVSKLKEFKVEGKYKEILKNDNYQLIEISK